MELTTHVNFGGDCEEAFRYYAENLGGSITMLMRQSELPGNYNVMPGFENAVVHARLKIGRAELIGNDVPKEYFQPIRSSYLYLVVDSTEDADRIWAALVDGGEATMPISETFFATRFGQLRDRFGVLWSVIHPKPMAR